MIGKTVHYVPQVDDQCRAAIVLFEREDKTVALAYFPYNGTGSPSGPMMEFCDSAKRDAGRARGTFHGDH